MEQRTNEWFAARCGKVTGSRVADVMAKTKTGYAATRENYLAQLVVEWMSKQPYQMTYTNSAMQWGTETEPLARSTYEQLTGELVDEIGFVNHPQIEMAGASPDGLVGEVGLLEIKCPNTATHFEYIRRLEAPKKYMPQMQWQMACTQREWCDFMSYDPRAPEGLQSFLVRVPRDDSYIKEIEQEVEKFLQEVDVAAKELNEIKHKTILLEIN
jgi:putative phage-type endonuclease